MVIVPTSASEGLARRISEKLGTRLVKPVRKRFPDGELYVRIPSGDDIVVVVGSTHQPDSNWVELLLTVDAARRTAKYVYLVIPYFGYSRQDRVFLPGEPVSSEVFLKALHSLGIEEILTVDVHFFRREGKTEKGGVAVYNASAWRELANHLDGVDVIVSPDKGSAWFGERIARELGVEHRVFHKERDRETGRLKMKGEKVEGKWVAVVDDMIASGGTMLLASQLIEAERLTFAAVHGVFAPGWEKLKERGEVVVADTIERPESKVSVAGVVARWLKSSW